VSPVRHKRVSVSQKTALLLVTAVETTNVTNCDQFSSVTVSHFMAGGNHLVTLRS
jgi:hypothetical protein